MGPQLTGLDAPSQAAYVAGFMAEYLSDSWWVMVHVLCSCFVVHARAGLWKSEGGVQVWEMGGAEGWCEMLTFWVQCACSALWVVSVVRSGCGGVLCYTYLACRKCRGQPGLESIPETRCFAAPQP